MTYNIFPKGALTHHSPLASGGAAFGSRALSEGDAASADAFQPISLREIGWAAGLRFTTERMASPCRRASAPRQLRQETGHRQVSCLEKRGTRNDEGNGDDTQ